MFIQGEGKKLKNLYSCYIKVVFRSMYFDEDGDLAHEFYEEVIPRKKGGKRKMRKLEKNLIPQGEVKYRVPRLHVDFPIILYSD